MKKYISTELVKAEPGENTITGEDGYQVLLEDGSSRWISKDAFERFHIPLEINEELRTKAPSIGPEMVRSFIAEKEVITMGGKTTVVRAVLKNGFVIVESSSCVSQENYDEGLGERICMKRIEGRVWSLLGFLLQTAVHGI